MSVASHPRGVAAPAWRGWASETGPDVVAFVLTGWASETGPDVVAFVLTGYAPVPALADVVDGSTAAVYRMPPGDPHPMSLLRVLFNAALCRSWYGTGPWDALARTWLHRHPLHAAPPESALVARATLPLFPEIVRVCTERPIRAFGGRPLSALADPRRVAPAELRRLADGAGAALYTSSDLETWLRRLGVDRATAAA